MTAMDPHWKKYVVSGNEHPGVLIHGLEESGGMSLHARILPRGHTNPHTHSGKETITAVSGEGILIRGDSEQRVYEGDSEIIPPTIVHSLGNARTDCELVLIAEFQPSFHEQVTAMS